MRAIGEAKKQAPLAVFSLLGFIALWAVLTDAWNYSGLLFSDRLRMAGTYLYGYFSRIIWMAPAFFLIFRFEQKLFWSGKQLFSRPRAEPVFVIFLVLTSIYGLLSTAGNDHSGHMADGNLLLLTVKLGIVGIGEELVFRGWGYNVLVKAYPAAVSLAVSACMFVLLHWPAYFIKLLLYGQFDLPGFAAQSVSALVCGLLFAVMLKRSGTLWNPVIAHFYYDWVLEVFG